MPLRGQPAAQLQGPQPLQENILSRQKSALLPGKQHSKIRKNVVKNLSNHPKFKKYGPLARIFPIFYDRE